MGGRGQVPIFRAMREAQGLSVTGLAELAGVDAGTLSRIERGLIEPKSSTLLRICAALGLTTAADALAELELPELVARRAS